MLNIRYTAIDLLISNFDLVACVPFVEHVRVHHIVGAGRTGRDLGLHRLLRTQTLHLYLDLASGESMYWRWPGKPTY